MKDFIQSADTVHSYTGGGIGANGHDGNFATAQTVTLSGGGGSSLNVDLTSKHVFSTPRLIKRIDYYLQADSSSDGSTDNGASAYSYIETQDATTLLWTTVPGSSLSQSHNNGGGGGATGHATSTNPTSLSVNIPNVIAIRAACGSHAFTNGSGNTLASGSVYEIQAYGPVGGFAGIY